MKSENDKNKFSMSEVIELETSINSLNRLKNHTLNIRNFLLEILRDKGEDPEAVFNLLVKKHKNAGARNDNQLYYLSFAELLSQYYDEVKEVFLADVIENTIDWLGAISSEDAQEFVGLYLTNILDYIKKNYQ